MLPTKFWFIWPYGFRGEEYKKSANQKQESPVVAMFVNGLGQDAIFIEDLPQMLPTKFRIVWPSGFRGEDFQKSTNQKQELPGHVCKQIGTKLALFKEDRPQMLPTKFGSLGQAVSEEKNLLIQPIRNKSRLWWPCLLTDRDEMSIIYRGPSIDTSYQVSVHLAKRFQKRRFVKICIEITAF